MVEADKIQQRRLRRFVAGLAGGVVVLVGIIAIPYPGPGWLIVFAGLAILSREFKWARKLLKFGRKKYDDWNTWVSNQNWPIKTALFLFTSVVVILTIWLVNGYGLMNEWLNLGLDWLRSPLFIPK